MFIKLIGYHFGFYLRRNSWPKSPASSGILAPPPSLLAVACRNLTLSSLLCPSVNATHNISYLTFIINFIPLQVVAPLAVKAAMASSASSLLLAGQAAAASEVAQLAGDNRLSTIALLLVPVLGWVGFQIGGPALRQLDNMNDKAGK